MKSFCSILLLSILFSSFSQAQNPVEIIEKMRSEITKINKSSFELHSKERFGDKYVYKKMKFRMQERPKKVYMKDLDKGVELLYVDGWNKNKGFINPAGFPWINVSLSIYDSKVVADNHHTVSDAGLGFVNKLLNGFEGTVSKAGKTKSSLYNFKGEVTYNGRTCYKLYISPPVEFKYISYTTKEDMKLMKLSRKIVASDFLIKEKNNLSYSRTIKKGTKLQVPTAYAKKVVVYIDAKTYLPVCQMLFDDKGLLEKYEYKKISTYPKFSSSEFTTDCSLYGF
jgi:outer membrane lipoprotein-sorting protein